MRQIWIVLAGLAIVAGCTPQQVDKAGNPIEEKMSESDAAYESDQVPRIRETFNRMREAIIAGDTRTYFDLMSSTQQETYGGYDAFVSLYTVHQNGWREMWRGAEVRKIAIDERDKEKASVLVRWSTPGPHLIEFVLQDGTWRFHYVVPE